MKQLFVLSAAIMMAACGESKKEEAVMIKRIVCGDSIEQKMYDENGIEYMVRMPGPCDTILEPEMEH